MESRKLSKEPNDYFSDEEIAMAKETFPKSDRIHKLIARLEAAERYATLIREGREGWFNPEYEAWRESRGL